MPKPFAITITQPIPAAPEWSASYTVAEHNGTPVIAELHIKPTATGTGATHPPGGVTASLLRHVPMGRSIVAQAVQAAVGHRGNLLFSARAIENGRRGRGIRHDDRFLAAVAAAYVDLLPTSDDVYADLSEILAKRAVHYGREGARELVRKARARELLSGAPKGRAGGRLTPRAVALLDEH